MIFYNEFYSENNQRCEILNRICKIFTEYYASIIRLILYYKKLHEKAKNCNIDYRRKVNAINYAI